MIRLRDLEKHMRQEGCALLRQGSSHAIWWNPENQKRTSVPRHRELPLTTAKAICRQLEIPLI